MRLFGYFLALSLAFSSQFALASKFDDLYLSAFIDFDKRGATVENAKTCVTKAQEAFNAAENDVQKFDAKILQARCQYFVGNASKDEKEQETLFTVGKDYATEAKNLQPERAEGYYYFGICLGRWGRAVGPVTSYKFSGDLQEAIEASLDKEAYEKWVIKKDGKFSVKERKVEGREYDGYGPYRTLGAMYFELKLEVLGADFQKSEEYLREAVENMEEELPNSLNVVYLARTLVKNNKKAEAKKLLDNLIAYEYEPATYNPRRVPETIEDIQAAKKLRGDL